MTMMSTTCSRPPRSTGKRFHLGLGERIAKSATTIARYDNVRRTHCALKCVKAKSCQSFFYHKVSGRCEIHKKATGQIKPGSKITGQQYYSHWEGAIRSNTESNSRLLFVEIQTSKFHTLSLHNHSESDYQYIHNRLSVTPAVAYIPSTKRILVAINRHRGQILSYPIYGRKPKILKQRMDCSAIAPDEDGILVFLFIRPRTSKGNVLSSMTLSGGFYKEMYNVGNSYIRGIATVSKDKLVYFCFKDKIMSISYDGEDKKVIFTGSSIMGLDLDKSRNVLYFIDKKTVQIFSLLSNTSTVVASFPKASQLENIIYYQNEIFFQASYWSTSEIWVRNVINNDTKRVVLKSRKMTYCTFP